MRTCPRFTLALLAIAGSLIAEEPEPISINISAKPRVETDLGDAILHIEISNRTKQAISLPTGQPVEKVGLFPPVSIDVNGENGASLIVGPMVKDRTTREVHYALDAGETKVHEVRIRDLVWHARRLADGIVGDVSVQVTFTIVRYENRAYNMTAIRSSIVKINVIPTKTLR